MFVRVTSTSVEHEEWSVVHIRYGAVPPFVAAVGRHTTGNLNVADPLTAPPASKRKPRPGEPERGESEALCQARSRIG